MIGNVFGSKSKTSVFNELLEVINKGIDLLAKDSINKELLDAWRKYAFSTLDLVDSVFGIGYSTKFLFERPFQSLSFSNCGFNYNFFSDFPTTAGRNPLKDNLREYLKKLIDLAKRLPKE